MYLDSDETNNKKPKHTNSLDEDDYIGEDDLDLDIIDENIPEDLITPGLEGIILMPICQS